MTVGNRTQKTGTGSGNSFFQNPAILEEQGPFMVA